MNKMRMGYLFQVNNKLNIFGSRIKFYILTVTAMHYTRYNTFHADGYVECYFKTE